MIRAIAVWILLALPAAAQSLPEWDYTSVNDFAKMLSSDDTRVLDQALIALHEDTGVEGTVVTLDDRASHGGGSGLEVFATRLFNYWGIGDKRKNDGFMVLILRDDREARIELGAGYPATFDRTAQQIMDNVMLPEFRGGDYSTGLRKGTLAVIEKIARPYAAGSPPPAQVLPPRAQMMDPPAYDQNGRTTSPTPPQTDKGGGMFWFWVMFLGIFSTPVLGGLAYIWIRGRCPKCGNRDLVEIEEPIRKELSTYGWSVSRMDVERLCQKCGWSTHVIRNLNYTDRFGADGVFMGRTHHHTSSSSSGGSSSSSSSSGFGGGSSSGGGASGKW